MGSCWLHTHEGLSSSCLMAWYGVSGILVLWWGVEVQAHSWGLLASGGGGGTGGRDYGGGGGNAGLSSASRSGPGPQDKIARPGWLA